MKNSVHFMNTTEVPTFNLLKIHGGINWLTNEVGDITKDSALSQVVKVSDALKALKMRTRFNMENYPPCVVISICLKIQKIL